MCDTYRKYFPSLYEISCKGGRHSTVPKGAGATFSSAFNVNSANLPNEPSPYGLETIASRIDDGSKRVSPSFSLIKGFHRIGTGISTTGNNTFFGNDLVQRQSYTPKYQSFDSHETQKSKAPNLNFGTSIGLMSLGRGEEKTSVSIGMTLRHNQTTGTIGYGAGIYLKKGIFTLGLGGVREKTSNLYPRVNFLSGVAGVRLMVLELEYTQLQNKGGPELGPIHIESASLYLGPLILTGAKRQLRFANEGWVDQNHLAAQLQVSKHFVLGYLYNYIPGANSIACQIFL